MRRLSKSVAVAMSLACALAARAGDGPIKPNLGTWTLNLGKSKPEAWVAKSQTRVYEEREGGLLHARYEGTDASGNPTFVEFEARLDGKPYPYAVRGGSLTYTVVLKPVDDHSFAFEVKATFAQPFLDRNGTAHEGRMAWTGTHTVAADGKTFTDSYKTDWHGDPSRAVLVFEKK
jgi:hypothetical protein